MSALKVEIRRLPLTTPCPVPVTPEGESVRNGEAIPMEKRTELCAVDAEWMIGTQRCCDIHLRIACDLGGIEWNSVVEEAFAEWGQGAIDRAHERNAVPWSERHRYSQAEARSWAETAKEHGLA